MTINITINPPEDFKILCDIFQISPEAIIQKFTEQLSLLDYYRNPQGRDRWATLFFLNYLDTQHTMTEAAFASHHYYLDLLLNMLSLNIDKEDENAAKIEAQGRKIISAWHSHALASRNGSAKTI